MAGYNHATLHQAELIELFSTGNSFGLLRRLEFTKGLIKYSFLIAMAGHWSFVVNPPKMAYSPQALDPGLSFSHFGRRYGGIDIENHV